MPGIEEIIKNSNEPDVTKAVFDSIQSFGDNSKKNYNELRKSHEEMKKVLDKNDVDTLVTEKVEKLSEDITTRQNAIDGDIAELNTSITKRLDEIEIAGKRPAMASGKDAEKIEKDVKDFYNSLRATQVPDHGAKFSMNQKEDTVISMEEYQLYAKNFEAWARLGDEKTLKTVPEMLKSMLVGSDPDGGFVVPTAMGNRIIERMFEVDPMRSLASIETISTGSIEWLVDFDEADAKWEGGETVIIGESGTPQLKKKRINVFSLAARTRLTQTLLEDSAINIESWLGKHVGAKMGRMEAASFISGDGVGKPRGFLTWPNGEDGNYGVIEQIPMLHATKLTPDGFIDMKYSMVEQYLNRGTWLMNRSTVRETTKLKTGDGDYIWKPGITTDAMATILGLPIRMSPTMPAVAANALSVALADWKEAYMIVDRLGISTQRDPFTQKPFIEFYTRKRVGGDVINYQAIKLGKISA